MGKKPDISVALKAFKGIQGISESFDQIGEILDTLNNASAVMKNAIKGKEEAERSTAALKHSFAIETEHQKTLRATWEANTEKRDRVSVVKKRELEVAIIDLEKQFKDMDQSVRNEYAAQAKEMEAKMRQKRGRIASLDADIRDRVVRLSSLNGQLEDIRKSVTA